MGDSSRPTLRSAFGQLAASLIASGAGGAKAGAADARGVHLHVSALRALQAWGVPESEARALVLQARREGHNPLQHAIGPCPALPAGGVLFVRRMPGNHAEAWVVAVAAALPENNP
jgi:hypothetical protein